MNNGEQFFNTAAGGYSISRSLRFNSSDSAYLSRTPASAGNRKTWTWAGWVKNCLGPTPYNATLLFARNGAGTGVGEMFWVAINCVFTAGGYQLAAGDGASNYLVSTALFRDPSSWYHIVCAYDSTQATADNRLRMYVNGVEITTWSTNNRSNITLNSDSVVSRASVQHEIGSRSAIYSDCYLADVHLVDGQALDPTSFGEFSATTGVWVPKAYTGTYGTNGFKLDFADNSAATAAALGKDTSGNGNNWTPNNLIAGPTTVSNSWSGYFDGTGDYLSIPDNTALGGFADFTIEFWAFFDSIPNNSVVLTKGWVNGAYAPYLVLIDSGALGFYAASGTTSWNIAQLNIIPSIALKQWYHVAITRSGSSIRTFANGNLIATATNSTATSANASALTIGAAANGTGGFNGYLSNVRIVKGTAVYTAAFTPPSAPLTAITNTSLLALQSSTFVDNSANTFAITASGNARVSVTSPFEEFLDTDSLVDVPVNGSEVDSGLGGQVKGNYATWNPLLMNSLYMTARNGNLEATCQNSNYNPAALNIHVRVGGSGKWYCEFLFSATPQNDFMGFGLAAETSSIFGTNQIPGSLYMPNGQKSINGTKTTYGSSYVAGDIIGVTLDEATGSLTCYKNGVSQGLLATLTTGSYQFIGVNYGIGTVMTVNAGQRPFAYTAPSGFKALCTANLPAPVVTKASDLFDVKLYTGNGSTQTISGLGFSPDLVWIKARNTTNAHQIFDTVRGASIGLSSNTTDADSNNAPYGLTSFGASSFNVNDISNGGYGVNGSSLSQVYAAWAWDAGNTTVTNTQGSISSQVRANVTAGFSVVTYTGTGANATVGHGLGVAPQLIITKCRGAASDWGVYHASVGATAYLRLNLTNASSTGAGPWNNTAPTSTVFSIGTNAATNTANTMVAYCFAPVAGYSSFGSYTGNGSADGPFVFCGFRPRWILIKASSSVSYGNWVLHDTARSSSNVSDKNLYANLSNSEDSTYSIDVLSNGFKLRSAAFDGTNGSGATYVYCAFAESPFAANNRAR
jgi:hypothetical protein